MNEIHLDGKVSFAYVALAVSQNLGPTYTSYFQTAHSRFSYQVVGVTRL
jgi:hypothetical protein